MLNTRKVYPLLAVSQDADQNGLGKEFFVPLSIICVKEREQNKKLKRLDEAVLQNDVQIAT